MSYMVAYERKAVLVALLSAVLIVICGSSIMGIKGYVSGLDIFDYVT